MGTGRGFFGKNAIAAFAAIIVLTLFNLRKVKSLENENDDNGGECGDGVFTKKTSARAHRLCLLLFIKK